MTGVDFAWCDRCGGRIDSGEEFVSVNYKVENRVRTATVHRKHATVGTMGGDDR